MNEASSMRAVLGRGVLALEELRKPPPPPPPRAPPLSGPAVGPPPQAAGAGLTTPPPLSGYSSPTPAVSAGRPAGSLSTPAHLANGTLSGAAPSSPPLLLPEEAGGIVSRGGSLDILVGVFIGAAVVGFVCCAAFGLWVMRRARGRAEAKIAGPSLPARLLSVASSAADDPEAPRPIYPDVFGPQPAERGRYSSAGTGAAGPPAPPPARVSMPGGGGSGPGGGRGSRPGRVDERQQGAGVPSTSGAEAAARRGVTLLPPIPSGGATVGVHRADGGRRYSAAAPLPGLPADPGGMGGPGGRRRSASQHAQAAGGSGVGGGGGVGLQQPKSILKRTTSFAAAGGSAGGGGGIISL